eukprot:GILK01034672.1.p2 GENE.GILK01034672.1~~GILK01034672.1.p2  ORF type:complete len:100 (-),score=1.44 GILK01034672.1:32-331(-)
MVLWGFLLLFYTKNINVSILLHCLLFGAVRLVKCLLNLVHLVLVHLVGVALLGYQIELGHNNDSTNNSADEQDTTHDCDDDPDIGSRGSRVWGAIVIGR